MLASKRNVPSRVVHGDTEQSHVPTADTITRRFDIARAGTCIRAAISVARMLSSETSVWLHAWHVAHTCLPPPGHDGSVGNSPPQRLYIICAFSFIVTNRHGAPSPSGHTYPVDIWVGERIRHACQVKLHVPPTPLSCLPR